MAVDAQASIRLADGKPLRDLLYALSEYLTQYDQCGTDGIGALRAAVEAMGLPYHTSHQGSEAVHDWFSLSYANYLVLHRTLLQQMDADWQQRFVRCLEELDAVPWDVALPAGYRVHCVDAAGKYLRDPVPHYRRGSVSKKQPAEVVA